MRIWLAAWCIGLSMITGQALAKPNGPTLGEINFALDQYGKNIVVRWLYDTGRWPAVFDHIANGEGPWIALASRLQGSRSAAPSEDLDIALTLALPMNPRAVLAELGTGSASGKLFFPNTVCDPNIYPDEGSIDFATWRRRALVALAAVHDADLADQKAACIAILRQARARD